MKLVLLPMFYKDMRNYHVYIIHLTGLQNMMSCCCHVGKGICVSVSLTHKFHGSSRLLKAGVPDLIGHVQLNQL